jgi:predicted Zn-dependent protease
MDTNMPMMRPSTAVLESGGSMDGMPHEVRHRIVVPPASEAPSDPVMSEAALKRIADTVFELTNGGVKGLQVEHSARIVTRVANNRVLTTDNGHDVRLTFKMAYGGRKEIEFATNLVDAQMLQRSLRALGELANDQFGPTTSFVLQVATPQQQLLPVKLWKDTSSAAMTEAATTAVPQMLTPLGNSGLKGSGFLGFSARAVYAGEPDGHRAYCRETDVECTVSARFADGTASGWYGQANRDWTKIDPKMVAEKAIDMAQRSKGPSAVEPGRHTAVLSPFAVAQLMAPMATQFDAYATNENRQTVFTVFDDPTRDNKIGLRVLDPRINITSDPLDPEGGYTPFGDWPGDDWAMPTQSMTYVDKGILKDLAFIHHYSLYRGKPFNQDPWSMRVEAVPGTKLLTEEEMIAQCKRGIYVNRFSHVSTLDPLSALESGVTRDGCFLIKDGKINRPVKNFRFIDSPMFALNRLVAIGTPRRVPFGYMPGDTGQYYFNRWPRRPMIVPPIMVDDFNFSAMSDAV